MARSIDWNDLSVDKMILGWGSYGDVYEATWNSIDGPQNIAIKKFRPFIKDLTIEKEFGLLSLANHDNIVRFLGITKDGDNRTVMVMEYAECGSLYNMLHNNGISLAYTRRNGIGWMLQCAKGVEYLHKFSPKILHRDLKPQNLLLFNDCRTLKICDFGTAKELATKMSNGVGTARYMAPEVSIENSYTEKCDVYSFGITFWEVMSKKKPFYHLGETVDFHIQKKAIEGDRPLINDIQNMDKSDLIIKLIEQCWDGDSTQRPAMQDVIRDIHFLYSNNKEHFNMEELTLEDHDSSENLKVLGNIGISAYEHGATPEAITPKVITTEYIGSGTFSDVFKAIWRTEEDEKIIAVKIYRGRVLTESTFVSRLRHRNILTYYDIRTNTDRRTCLLSEYADCGNLYNALHLGDSSYQNALTWMLQLAKGVAFMHQQNIIHGDLKPKKLLLFNNYQTLKISLSDFICIKPTTMTKMVGESYYMAPEIVEGSKYTEKCDVYSFGIILWEVISRKKPFYNLENKTSYFILNKVIEGLRPDVNVVNGIQHSAQIKMWITNCWDADPEKRPTMHELMTNFTHIA
ncbi:mitogen-activated protein kinase kinase kinase 20-like isoform X1 [Drosophila sulfurigaster albostrigata]|uniref:mitogen-activated protein kinase kinase kinase 20-like isoform X1 n=1 Tax=Drosophila sulfurigaster albostrigata TaxID=89887 RepID=UPI002D21913A|nr:mitogen-activated protein kinase kinase kinase 20-like isoform X1 [Drosophila sulfurigaster albostrigata]